MVLTRGERWSIHVSLRSHMAVNTGGGPYPGPLGLHGVTRDAIHLPVHERLLSVTAEIGVYRDRVKT